MKYEPHCSQCGNQTPPDANGKCAACHRYRLRVLDDVTPVYDGLGCALALCLLGGPFAPILMLFVLLASVTHDKR